MHNIRKEDGVVIGNVYQKYNTKNPVSSNLINRFVRNLDELVEKTGANRICEVGCGEGFLSSRYADGTRHVIATDFSKEIIAHADELHADKDMEFRVRSIYELTQEEDSAELVLCCEVLEHLEAPEKALACLSNISEKWCVISVPREPLWRLLNISRGKYISEWGNTPGHVQHWGKRQICRFVEHHFVIDEIRSPLPWTMLLCRKHNS